MYINSFNQGVLFADIKSFRMPHPEKADKEIWYASLEGPEAGAYDRGTGQLVNGEAFIPFSEDYNIVANSETMTVQLTPHGWDTYGLAVVTKSKNGFYVKELKGGEGNFKFDWEVKCKRSGREEFQVIRRSETIPTPKEEERIQKQNTNERSAQKSHINHPSCALNKQ